MELTIDKTGPFPVACLSGEWRATSGDDFQGQLHSLVAEAGAKLAIDVSGLTMIDSSGLGTLISVVTHARLAQARVVVVNPSAFVRGVFEVTNLDQWFELCESLEAAAALLASE